MKRCPQSKQTSSYHSRRVTYCRRKTSGEIFVHVRKRAREDFSTGVNQPPFANGGDPSATCILNLTPPIHFRKPESVSVLASLLSGGKPRDPENETASIFWMRNEKQQREATSRLSSRVTRDLELRGEYKSFGNVSGIYFSLNSVTVSNRIFLSFLSFIRGTR